MPHMIIMRGGPGSGKSTLARELAANRKNTCGIYSADDFFITTDGQYDFDPQWLGPAHGRCLRNVVEAIIRRDDVVVDNTNAGPSEMIPYLALCQAFGYTCEVIRVLCDPEVAFARQTHGVPREKFLEITAGVEQNDVPKLYQRAPWLSCRDVRTDDARPRKS